MTNQTKTLKYQALDAETGEILGTMTFDPDNPESVKAIVILANDPKIKIVTAE